MAKQEAIQVEGIVTDVLPDQNFTVEHKEESSGGSYRLRQGRRR